MKGDPQIETFIRTVAEYEREFVRLAIRPKAYRKRIAELQMRDKQIRREFHRYRANHPSNNS